MDQDLVDFLNLLAAENRTTVEDIMTQYLRTLKRAREDEQPAESSAHPAFQEALQAMQPKPRDGTARWYSFDDAFPD